MLNFVYNREKAHILLRNLGISPRYRGYEIVLCALDCIAADSNCLTAFIKEICIPVSEKKHCGYATVEAEIRRTSERAWQNNPTLLMVLAERQLDHRPPALPFLEILYFASCEKQGNL